MALEPMVGVGGVQQKSPILSSQSRREREELEKDSTGQPGGRPLEGLEAQRLQTGEAPMAAHFRRAGVEAEEEV